jgi:hypothetical protein
MVSAIIFGIIMQHVINQIMAEGIEAWLPVIEWREDERDC